VSAATGCDYYVLICPIRFTFDFAFSSTPICSGLAAKPSGLCLPHFFCAFNNCMVNPDQPNNSILEGLVDTDNVMITQAYSQINSTIKGWIDDTSNPMYNLPSKVLFPTSESDVVAAVRFAKEHGLEV
jgi:hypothetical protein